MKSLKDRRLKAVFLGRYRTGREWWRAVTALIVAVLTLFGLGQGIVALYEGVTSSDQLHRLAARVSGPGRQTLPVTLIAIDDATHKQWGLMPTTPHKALSELTVIARDAKALAILLDFDLSFDDPLRPADPTLYNMLARYGADAPPLMIVRTAPFVRIERGTHVAEAFRATDYDTAVKDKPNVIWVSAVTQFASDRVVRRLRLWQTHCQTAGGEVHPAPPMAVLAVLAGPERLAELRDYLKARAVQECSNGPEPTAPWPQFRGASASIPFTIGRDGRAISQTNIERAAGSVPLIETVSAGSLVRYTPGNPDQAEPAGQVDSTLFKDRVVVVGVTHADTPDILPTPFGSMHGAVILANTLVSASEMVEVPEPGAFARNSVAFILFVAFGVVAARLNAAPAAIVIGLVGTVALALFSYRLGFGAALEALATGLAAFGLFKLLDSIVSIIHDWRRGRGWRAIFKPPHSSAS